MSCTISRNFPLLPFEPVPQGPTLAHWRNEIAKLWEGTADDIEGCIEGVRVDIPVPDDSRLTALEVYVYGLDLANSYIHTQSSPSALWDMFPKTPTGEAWSIPALVQLFDATQQIYGQVVRISFANYQAQFTGNLTGTAVFKR